MCPAFEESVQRPCEDKRRILLCYPINFDRHFAYLWCFLCVERGEECEEAKSSRWTLSWGWGSSSLLKHLVSFSRTPFENSRRTECTKIMIFVLRWRIPFAGWKLLRLSAHRAEPPPVGNGLWACDHVVIYVWLCMYAPLNCMLLSVFLWPF